MRWEVEKRPSRQSGSNSEELSFHTIFVTTDCDEELLTCWPPQQVNGAASSLGAARRRPHKREFQDNYIMYGLVKHNNVFAFHALSVEKYKIKFMLLGVPLDQ